MRRLRTSTYPDKDLFVAVQKLARSLEREAGLVVRVSFHQEGIDLPQQTSTELYQIVHEALTNVRKHAEARQVSVRLDRNEGWLHLVITDDGKGFPTSLADGGVAHPPWSIA